MLKATNVSLKHEKMQASVARCLRTPPTHARELGLCFSAGTAYAARATGARLSFAIVLIEPITVVSHRAKANIFRRLSILFRPHQQSLIPSPLGGAAGYRPRVQTVYYMRVYRHSSLRSPIYIMPKPPNINISNGK